MVVQTVPGITAGGANISKFLIGLFFLIVGFSSAGYVGVTLYGILVHTLLSFEAHASIIDCILTRDVVYKVQVMDKA